MDLFGAVGPGPTGRVDVDRVGVPRVLEPVADGDEYLPLVAAVEEATTSPCDLSTELGMEPGFITEAMAV